jgi:hypothetical protein
MPNTILFPITREHVEEAITAAEDLARQARARDATVLVLQTECLHGLLTDISDEYVDMESRRIMACTERVAEALRAHGGAVETVWECVQVPRRPVDLDTVKRLGADAVYVVHHGGLGGLFEALALRRLRHHGVDVLRSGPAPVEAESTPT